jgi:hypothetical protein
MITVKELEKLYCEDMLTDAQIAKKIGVHKQTVFELRKKHNIKSVQKHERINLNISQFQDQVIRGTIMGDAHLTFRSHSESQLEVKHSIVIFDQSDYIRWLYFCLRDLCPSAPKLCQNNTRLRLRSHHHPWFSKLREEFYNKDGVKTITRECLNKLSPLSIAVWYMYDGALQDSNSAKLSTHNFTYEEHQIIKQWIEESYNIYPKIQKDGPYFWLRFTTKEANKLWRLIDKYIIPSMRYKIGDMSGNRLAYLAGAMEMVPDEGEAWRREYAKKLSEIGIRSIIPNDEENNIKRNVNMKSLKTKDINKYIFIMRDFMRADITFIEAADFFITRWEGEISAGTMGEATFAFLMKKPSYLITSMFPKDVPGWFLACFTEVFSSIDELIEYLKKNKR